MLQIAAATFNNTTQMPKAEIYLPLFLPLLIFLIEILHLWYSISINLNVKTKKTFLSCHPGGSGSLWRPGSCFFSPKLRTKKSSVCLETVPEFPAFSIRLQWGRRRSARRQTKQLTTNAAGHRFVSCAPGRCVLLLNGRLLWTSAAGWNGCSVFLLRKMKHTFPPLTFVNVDVGKPRLCFLFCLPDDGGWLSLRLQLLDKPCQSSTSLSTSVDASLRSVFTAKKI